MITFTQRGSFDRTERYLHRLKSAQLFSILNKYGAMGVAALSANTPALSGLSADSWSYSIISQPRYYSIRWHNSNYVAGVPLVVLLQYGHGTGTGGYVQGRDFINPAVRPIFEQMLTEAMEEVNRI